MCRLDTRNGFMLIFSSRASISRFLLNSKAQSASTLSKLQGVFGYSSPFGAGTSYSYEMVKNELEFLIGSNTCYANTSKAKVIPSD